MITLRCNGCGREAPYGRHIDAQIPAVVTEIVHSACDQCEQSGDFISEHWLDANGNEVTPTPYQEGASNG